VKATARKLSVLVLCTSLSLALAGTTLSNVSATLPADTVQQTDSAATALQEGRRLLKRGRADQALGKLQTALSLYTASKNRKGIAAAHNELGDLYLRQGQNKLRSITISKLSTR